MARTAPDVRDTIVEGESGIMAVSPPWFRPTYTPSKRRLVWPNGVMATTYSADEPDLLRGPQNHYAWADELAAWRYPEAWDQLQFGLRLGAHPRAIVTTTPRPTKIIRELLAHPATVVTRGSTFDNRSNLPQAFFDKVVRKYEGTRLGRQELEAEILDDAPGALWKRDALETNRRATPPDMRRIVVAIDPAVTATEESDETGIVVCGLGDDQHGYVLDDLSGRYGPLAWASRAVYAYERHRADAIVIETNQGGDMAEQTIRTVNPNVRVIRVHASRGKRTRAEPVAALDEQGRIHHVGMFAELEDQMCSWDPASADSPDRIDARVWGFTELMLGEDTRSEFTGDLPI